MSVAIQASRRGKITKGSSVLILGAGAVGLLCATMSKLAGSNNVVVADLQSERVDFATTQHAFADRGVVVPSRQGRDVEEKLQIARETAALACQKLEINRLVKSEFDVVFECTGAEACTQAAIYVSNPCFCPLRPLLNLDTRQRGQVAKL